MIDALVAELASEAAAELEARARHELLLRVNERDHLQPCCVPAARALAARWVPPAEFSTVFRVRSELWPRLGGVDVALSFPDQKPIAIELKCGSGRDALGPCAWDVLKLAFALQLGEISAGYLLGAAPAGDWAVRHRGTELFEDASLETLALRERFLDWWRQWERLGDPMPTEVPRLMRTRAVAQIPFEVGAETWELRVAAVSVDGAERMAWLPTRVPPSV